MTSTELLEAVDEMRQLARKTAALARAGLPILDDVVHGDSAKPARLEDLGYLLDATAEAAEATVNVGVKLEMGFRALHPRSA